MTGTGEPGWASHGDTNARCGVKRRCKTRWDVKTLIQRQSGLYNDTIDAYKDLQDLESRSGTAINNGMYWHEALANDGKELISVKQRKL